ncbi:hypothetical protein LTR49_026895 [Elasticomyces elasticus]|nr:hypothetical protein LTR49_026895 [Elasticomyces elasticus]
MSPKNRAKHLELLKDELDEDKLRMILTQALEQQTESEQEGSPAKRANLDNSGLNMLTDVALEMDSGTVNPAELFHQPATVPAVSHAHPYPSTANLDAVLVQQRMNLALATSAEFAGPLLQHFASTTPKGIKHAPTKKTRLSARQQPMLRSRQKRCKGTEAQQDTQPAEAHPTRTTDNQPLLPTHRQPDPYRPSPSAESKPVAAPDDSPTKRGARRTRKVWDPTEKTPEQALKDFVVPEMCKSGPSGGCGSRICG